VKQQITQFLTGFHELIPRELISVFNNRELELLIAGLPDFNFEDLKDNIDYDGYTSESDQIVWFWEIIKSFSPSDLALLLQFVTGSSKIPLDGFKALQGMNGLQNFQIKRLRTRDLQRLPIGHTCFNQLDLPEYPTKEILQERLLFAIQNCVGFGMV